MDRQNYVNFQKKFLNHQTNKLYFECVSIDDQLVLFYIRNQNEIIEISECQ